MTEVTRCSLTVCEYDLMSNVAAVKYAMLFHCDAPVIDLIWLHGAHNVMGFQPVTFALSYDIVQAWRAN